MQQFFNRTSKYAALSFAVALVAGCGGGGGRANDSTTTTTVQASTGVAVDFYLSGSNVTFANPSCDATVTDSAGSFTIPRADCGAITVRGGVDVATALPFNGVFTAPAGSTVVTPVTTLIQSLIASGKLPVQAQSTVMAALGLTQDPTVTDPMKDPEALTKTMALVQIAQQSAQAFSNVPGATTAKFEDIYAAILKEVGMLLPANATVALDASLVSSAAQAAARTLSPGNTVALNVAKASSPAIAAIAQGAADQITGVRIDLANTRGNASQALALVTSGSNVDDNIKTITLLSTELAAALVSENLATADDAALALAAARVMDKLSLSTRVVPPAKVQTAPAATGFNNR